MVSDKSSTIKNDEENTSIHNSVNVDVNIEGTKDDIKGTFTSTDEEKSVGLPAKIEEEPYTIFTKRRVIFFLFITSLTGMISPLTGSIYFPSTNQIEKVSFAKLKHIQGDLLME
jgi:hypothetical protein